MTSVGRQGWESWSALAGVPVGGGGRATTHHLTSALCLLQSLPQPRWSSPFWTCQCGRTSGPPPRGRGRVLGTGPGPGAGQGGKRQTPIVLVPARLPARGSCTGRRQPRLNPGSPPTGSSAASGGRRRSLRCAASWRTAPPWRGARSWTSGVAAPESSPSSRAAPGRPRQRAGRSPPPSSAAVSRDTGEGLAPAAQPRPSGRRLPPKPLPSSWPEACLSRVGRP